MRKTKGEKSGDCGLSEHFKIARLTVWEYRAVKAKMQTAHLSSDLNIRKDLRTTHILEKGLYILGV